MSRHHRATATAASARQLPSAASSQFHTHCAGRRAASAPASSLQLRPTLFRNTTRHWPAPHATNCAAGRRTHTGCSSTAAAATFGSGAARLSAAASRFFSRRALTTGAGQRPCSRFPSVRRHFPSLCRPPCRAEQRQTIARERRWCCIRYQFCKQRRAQLSR